MQIISERDNERKIIDICDGCVSIIYQNREIEFINDEGEATYTENWLDDPSSGASLTFRELLLVIESAFKGLY